MAGKLDRFSKMARYSRQDLALGKAAAERIHKLTVGIVGLGGIGGYSATMCCQAGVKKLVVADGDCVDPSNLARQVLYDEADIGRLKAKIAKDKLGKRNTDVQVSSSATFVDSGNIGRIFRGCDIILDCTDNYETRAAIDRYCRKVGIPWIYAGAIGTEAMAKLALPKGKPFSKWAEKPETRQTCDQLGVLSSTCAMAAAMQVRILFDWAAGKKEEPLKYSD